MIQLAKNVNFLGWEQVIHCITTCVSHSWHLTEQFPSKNSSTFCKQVLTKLTDHSYQLCKHQDDFFQKIILRLFREEDNLDCVYGYVYYNFLLKIQKQNVLLLRCGSSLIVSITLVKINQTALQILGSKKFRTTCRLRKCTQQKIQKPSSVY